MMANIDQSLLLLYYTNGPNANSLFTIPYGGIRMTKDNSLKLMDRLVLVALELLISDQEKQLIKRIHIANVVGVLPPTVDHPPAGYARIAPGRFFSWIERVLLSGNLNLREGLTITFLRCLLP